MSTASLLDRIRDLLAQARVAYAGTAEVAQVDAIEARLDEPLRVAIAGKVKAGKSTLLNALVGEELAPTDAGECTRVVTWYRDGHTYSVTMTRNDGSTRPLTFKRADGALDIDLQGVPPTDIDRLEVTWPSRQLEELTLIDTPGLGSLSTDVSARSEAFLSLDTDAEATEADAVIYLMRHLHHSDLDFLEAFHDDDMAHPSPINAIAVLSRSDEVGACRIDALGTAQRVAERLRNEPRMRQLCQTVVPVAGLLAQAAMTLTEDQYRQLQHIAELPHEEADALVLTVDRLVERGNAVLGPDVAETLLGALGLFGVRLSVSLIRLGVAPNAGVLSDELRRRSGISHLRELLLTIFTQRRDILKARAALASLTGLNDASPPPQPDQLRMDIERVTAGAHELTEVELLQVVRGGQLDLSNDESVELDRLFANIGGHPEARMGVEAADASTHAIQRIEHWRRRSENPLASRHLADTARAITRSYEGILATL